MKKVTLICAMAATLVLSGCLTTSIHPFYRQADLVFEPALLGNWTRTDEAGEHWIFEKRNEVSYQLTVVTSEKTNRLDAHLFTLDNARFLDLFEDASSSENLVPPIPAHMLLRVDEVTPTLKFSLLDQEWLKETVEKEPASTPHAVISGGKKEDARIVLTGTTDELQAFVRSHLKSAEAWKDAVQLQRD
jgi:hypothetical protein